MKIKSSSSRIKIYLNKMFRKGANLNLGHITRTQRLLSNIALVIGAVANILILFGVIFLFGNPGLSFIGAIIAVQILNVVIFFLFRKHQYYLGRLMYSATLLVAVFTYSSMVGIGAGLEYFFFPIGVGSYLIWPHNQKHQMLLTITSFLLFMYFTISAPGGLIMLSHWSKLIVFNLYLFNLGMSFLASFVALHALGIASHKTEVVLDDLHNRAKERASFREDQMLASLNALSLARDNETGNHIIRTQNYVKALALRLRSEGYFTDQLSDESIDLLFKAAPLHDIGKIGIPDGILLKKNRLTDEEWTVMKTHTLIGEAVLDAAHIEHDGEYDVIQKGIKIAGCHHEKWDGSGYPRGLAGESIPLEARIMSVADVYDALVSGRLYKEPWTHEQAVQEITSKIGTQFDPIIANIFLLEESHFHEIAEHYRDA